MAGRSIKGKTLWDWLPFLLQIAATILTLLTIVISVNQFTKQQQDQQNTLLIQQHDTILNTYLDRMSELLLSKDTPLGQSTPASPVRSVAQARTITALNTLDPIRQGIIIQFLHDSNLIAYDPAPDSTVGAIIHFYNVDLSGINLNKSHLNGVSLFDAILNGANLNEAILTSSNMHLVSMINGNLVKATLTGISFKEANLHGTNFKEANLHIAYLNDADLTNTNLTNANLSGADLTNANLNGADLTNANLMDTIGIIPKQLEQQAKSLHNTIMPGGTRHP